MKNYSGSSYNWLYLFLELRRYDVDMKEVLQVPRGSLVVISHILISENVVLFNDFLSYCLRASCQASLKTHLAI